MKGERGQGEPIGERINKARAVVRAGLDAKGQQLTKFVGVTIEKGKKLAKTSGQKIDQLLVLGAHGMSTVGDLTVTYKILPEKQASGYTVTRGHMKSVRASRMGSELGPQKSKLKRLTGGKMGQDREALTKERIGLPIIIQIPVELCAESNLQKTYKDTKLFAGKTTLGTASFASEKKEQSRKGPKAVELVAYLEVAEVTPEDNYQHRLRFGLATVDLGKRTNLHSLKSTTIRTANSVPTGSKGIDFTVEEATVDDIAERMVAWIAESDARVKKSDIYDALKIAATLNIGVSDFWKTVHANQSFETLMNMHRHVVVFALNTFLGSNDTRRASAGLNEFYARIARGEFKKFSDFVTGAREAAANLDPDASLSINMGLGAIQHVMRLTTQTIINKQGAQQVIDRIRGQSDSRGEVQDELLVSGDPLSVILMTPRFLTGVIDFTVKKYIPLVEETIRAHLEATEEALKTTRSGAQASAAFYRTVRESFEKQLPAIHRQLESGGKDVAQHLGEAVLKELNRVADETLGLNPEMTLKREPIVAPGTVIAGKIADLKEKGSGKKGLPKP